MADEGRITTERRGSVLLIGLDRPRKLNAFDVAMMRGLSAAYGELEHDDSLRCGVLFASGKHFTAGLDLAEVAPFVAQGQRMLAEGALDPWGLEEPYLTKPLVSAIHGLCYTAGIELMLATEVRVAAQDTRFTQLEVQRGIYPFGGATIRFVREVGYGNAMRYLLTGDVFSAEEALRMGLIQEVVETGQELARAIELAQHIAAQAPLGVRATMASARLALREGERAAIQRLEPDVRTLLQTEDAREGLQSFVERRTGNFKGR